MNNSINNDLELNPIKEKPIDLESIRLKKQLDMYKPLDVHTSNDIEEDEEEEIETLTISYGTTIKVEKKEEKGKIDECDK